MFVDEKCQQSTAPQLENIPWWGKI